MKSVEVEVSDVFWDIKRAFDAGAKIVVNEGSARSTKTYSIIQFLLGQCLISTGLRITICRAKLTWLKDSVLVDFMTILKNHFGMFDPANFNKTESKYTLNGNVISFIGLDEAQKVHGRKQDWFWINEAVEAKYKDFEQLIIRTTRGCILDYNPSCTEHWIYETVIPRDDCTFIHSTYKDNPFLESTIIDEIERLKDVDDVSWRIYGLGERAAHKGLIYGDAQVVSAFPENAKRVCYGLDFGFTNDPTAVIKVGVLHGQLFARELVYETGLVNTFNPLRPEIVSIEQRLKEAGVSKTDAIYADSAEPKSINELQNAGWNVIGVEKGADSIKAGIDAVKQWKMNITQDSTSLIKEKNMYKWGTDKDGRMMNKPVDAWNHGFDALRYAVWMGIRDNMPSIA